MLDDEKLSHVADWLLGPPLKILAILVLASVANWVGRRAVKRSLTKLHSGAVRERMGAMRKRTPAALLETGETSVRAEQRIDALSSVLRSVLSFVIWATAALMCLGEVGTDLGPLIAGAGVLGEPELWGVEQLGANGVMLRLVVKTTPSQQWRVSRELRERIKVAFDDEGIEIPFPQQTVWHKASA